jgi:hypothetical protein
MQRQRIGEHADVVQTSNYLSALACAVLSACGLVQNFHGRQRTPQKIQKASSIGLTMENGADTTGTTGKTCCLSKLV